MTDQARWKATVYIGGLAPTVNVESLQNAFLPFGEIADVSIPYTLLSLYFNLPTKNYTEKMMLRIQWSRTVGLAT
jgi:RNA recognition motif-containing protein